MNETQEKIYGLLESYLEYCRTNGYTEFEVWCEDNIDTINDDALVQDICQEVNHIADKLFEQKVRTRMFRRAKWIYWREKGTKQCKCSKCKTSYGCMDTPYCPNCGRKMIGTIKGKKV